MRLKMSEEKNRQKYINDAAKDRENARKAIDSVVEKMTPEDMMDITMFAVKTANDEALPIQLRIISAMAIVGIADYQVRTFGKE